MSGLPCGGAPQAKIEVCCGRGVGSYVEGLCNEELRSNGGADCRSQAWWEDVVSERTNVWPLIQPRASHPCAGLVLFLTVSKVFRIKSKGRQGWKTLEKTFVFTSIEVTMFIQPPPASGWDFI